MTRQFSPEVAYFKLFEAANKELLETQQTAEKSQLKTELKFSQQKLLLNHHEEGSSRRSNTQQESVLIL